MNRPGVGVLVILKSNNKVLLGKRKGSHGDGEWCFPGGHLELNETIEECGKREVMEETGISLESEIPITKGYTNDVFLSDKKHYITLYQEYILPNCTKPQRLEPNKCYEWDWFEENELP